MPQTITIVSVTPLAGTGLALHELPSAVQRLGERELARRPGQDLAELLESEALGVSTQAAQGNRHQLDLHFRGFTASPLLGQPQGLSVFLDGVRINEPFGDVVDWDLVPTAALAGVQLVPGSNPVYGLNTLGGALVLRTRSGRDDPGTQLEASTGSFGRRSLQFTQGGVHDGWDHFASLQLEQDSGARQHSGSTVQLGFVRLGRRDGDSGLQATLQLADNRLEGGQTIPLSWLDDPAQAYTWPDLTRNRLAALALQFTRHLPDAWSLTAGAHLRRHLSRNFSSNVGEDGGPEATNDLADVDQTSRGLALQLQHDARSERGVGALATLGASLDDAAARYTQLTQPAAFSADRGTVAQGGFAPVTDAGTRSRSLGLYALGAWSPSARWTFTASGRRDDTRVAIEDRSGTTPALDGRHRFARFNPALGASFHPAEDWNAFAGFSEGLRAPTAMELACADPQAPCRLPNGFVSDPALKPVVAQTFEAGVSVRRRPLTWSATVYRSLLRDDIQFVASQGSAQQGYFQNVGRTRRQGVELGLQYGAGPFALALRYAYLDARFGAGFVERSPWNSSAGAEGLVEVPSGARLPGLARQQAKLRLQWQGDAWTAGLDAQAVGSSLSRGDENNLAAGSKVPGHALVHLDAGWRPSEPLEWFARIENLLDRRVQTFGVLGNNAFTGPGRSFDAAGARAEPFRGPGAPRGVWVGLRWRWP